MGRFDAVLRHQRAGRRFRRKKLSALRLLLQVLYTVRSEPTFDGAARLQTSCFRWFVGLSIGRSGLGTSRSSRRNRERLPGGRRWRQGFFKRGSRTRRAPRGLAF